MARDYNNQGNNNNNYYNIKNNGTAFVPQGEQESQWASLFAGNPKLSPI